MIFSDTEIVVIMCIITQWRLSSIIKIILSMIFSDTEIVVIMCIIT